MKITPALVLLLFSTSLSCFLWGANAQKVPVLDIKGEKVRSGVEYYIESVLEGDDGGGLDFGSLPGKLCPKYVFQDSHDHRGRPMLIHPVDTNDPIVYESTDVNIEFVPQLDAYCRSPTLWKLDNYDPSSGKWWITIDGERGKPGRQTLNSWFKIQKVGIGYKLRFCPTVCASCVTLCNDIDVYLDDDIRRMGLTKEAGQEFFFVKASK